MSLIAHLLCPIFPTPALHSPLFTQSWLYFSQKYELLGGQSLVRALPRFSPLSNWLNRLRLASYHLIVFLLFHSAVQHWRWLSIRLSRDWIVVAIRALLLFSQTRCPKELFLGGCFREQEKLALNWVLVGRTGFEPVTPWLRDTKGMFLNVKRSNSWYLLIGDLASDGAV